MDTTMDLTSDDYENQRNYSDNAKVDEFPYKCKLCSEKFKQMEEVQAHFFRDHQKDISESNNEAETSQRATLYDTAEQKK